MNAWVAVLLLLIAFILGMAFILGTAICEYACDNAIVAGVVAARGQVWLQPF